MPMHIRYYLPERPSFRWYRQQPDCHRLALPATVTTNRAAPLSKASQLARKQAAELNKPEPLANARAHRFLDQIEAVHKAYKWLTVAPPPVTSAASMGAQSFPGEKVEKLGKKLEDFDLQDVLLPMDAMGFKLSAALLRKWFANPAYSVQSQAQKDGAYGAPFYPAAQVDSTSLTHGALMAQEHVKQAYEKIKSPEFLDSKPVRDALFRILSKTPQGVVDIDASAEFGADVQKQHRKYAFASVAVGKQFPGSHEDIRLDALDKSASATDDLALALGAFRWYAAIHRAHVFYNGRMTRRIQVQSIAFYAMAPYGFDDFDATLEFKGHWNKKHLALVTDGSWLNVPVYTGHDVYAKNAVLYPVFHEHFRRWRDIHQQGGDMLLFSERMTPYAVPSLDVVVPLEASPAGTLYWGGAGLNGPYIQPTLNALQNAGISDLYVGLSNTGSHDFGQVGTIVDAVRAGLLIRYEDDGAWTLTSGLNTGTGQFNLIGYSYGSLLAAQTANYYAKRGFVVDHLVLIGSPIDDEFLGKLRAHPNIKNILVINLTAEGDDIYAGMPQALLMNPSFGAKLAKDMLSGKGEGHFYYGHVVPGLELRLKALAEYIVSKGVR